LPVISSAPTIDEGVLWVSVTQAVLVKTIADAFVSLLEIFYSKILKGIYGINIVLVPVLSK
jgi:hypothetical protein